MNNFLNIDLLVFCALLLIIFQVGMYMQRRGFACSERLFLLLNLAMITVIVIDLISVIVDGQAGNFARFVNYSSNTILSVLQPLPAILWLCYIDFHIFKSKKRLKKRLFYLLPLSIGLVLSFISLKNGMVFTIDSNNIYHRGLGIYIIGGVNFLIGLYSWVLVFTGRKKMETKALKVVIFFSLMPIIGGGLQLLNYGVSLLWPCMTLGVVLVYIVLELNKDMRDYLTGLLNRQQIGDWIDSRIKNYGCSGPFSLVVVDIDNFDKIKSEFGTKGSDQALISMAHSMTKMIKHKDKVARFGESKFILILEAAEILAINEILARLINEIEKGNRYRDTFQIEFSSGYAVYHPSYYRDIVDFFEAATDMLDKTKKSRKRRKQTLAGEEDTVPLAVLG